MPVIPDYRPKGGTMKKILSSFMTTTFIASAVFAQANSSATAQASSQANTAIAPSSGAVTTVAPSAKKVKGSFTHLSSRDFKANSTTIQNSTENIFGVSYKPQDISYSASMKVYYDFVGRNQTDEKTGEKVEQTKQKALVSDLKLAATQTLAALGGSDPTSLKAFVLLPTSNKSHDNNQYLGAGLEYFIPYTLGNGFSTQVALFPTLKLLKGDDTFINYVYGEGRYAFTENVSTYLGVYHEYTGKLGVEKKRAQERILPELGLDVSVPEVVDLTFAVSQTRLVYSSKGTTPSRKDYALFAPEESSFNVQAAFKF
jgi:hypothetical protein